MGASGIRAGRAYVEVGTDEGPLDAGLRRVQARLQSFGKRMAVVGAGLTAASAAVTGPIAFAVKQAVSSGSELVAMNQKTGASIEALSELRYAAAQADVGFEQLGNGLKFQQKNLAAAVSGNETAAESFKKIGLSAGDLIRMAPDQAFERLADAINGVADPSMRTAAAIAIFGKSGSDLLPLFADGSRGIQMMRTEAKALGLQVKSQDAAAAEQFGDTWNSVLLTLRDVGEEIANSIIPVLNEILLAVRPIIVATAAWIAEHKTLVAWLVAVAVAVGVAGAAITALGFAAIGASAGISFLTGAFGILAAAVGFLGPVGLAVFAIGTAALVAAAYFQENWLKAFATVKAAAQKMWLDIRRSWLGDAWAESRNIVEQAIGGFAMMGMSAEEAALFKQNLLEDQQTRREERKSPERAAGREKEIDEQLRKEHARIDAEFAKGKKEHDAKIDGVDEAIAKAKADAEAAEAEYKKRMQQVRDDIEAAGQAEDAAQSDRQAAVESGKKTIAGRGTFSAAEAMRTAGQGFSLQNKIATATEKTARNTEKLKNLKPLLVTP